MRKNNGRCHAAAARLFFCSRTRLTTLALPVKATSNILCPAKTVAAQSILEASGLDREPLPGRGSAESGRRTVPPLRPMGATNPSHP